MSTQAKPSQEKPHTAQPCPPRHRTRPNASRIRIGFVQRNRARCGAQPLSHVALPLRGWPLQAVCATACVRATA